LYACQCSLALKERTGTLANFAPLSIAICTDEVLVGNIGADHTSYNVVGPAVDACFTLSKLNHQLQTQILVASHTIAEVPGHFEYRAIDLVQFPMDSRPKFASTGLVEVFELLKEREVNDEWMYSLEQLKMDTPYDKAWGLIKQGHYSTAAVHLKSHTEAHPEDVGALRLLNLSRRAGAEQTPYKRVIGVPWQVLEGLAATEDSPGCTQTSTLVRQMSTASQGLRDLKAPTVTTSIARLIREDSSAPSVESPKGDALGLTSVAQDLCALSAAGL
jgi:hypothetical protein